MKIRSEVAVYDYKAVASKFTAHDTQFNVVQGKINALVSESEITNLVNGGKTMYSRLAAAEMTVDSISTQVSDQILGDAATSLKSRISTVEQTATSITSRVSAVETNGVTKTNLVSVIEQKAGQISVKILKGAGNNDTVQTLLSANADAVRLTTGKLSWKATNSEMTQDGTLKCKNAELTGKITASSGSIAGWTIGSTSISGTISGWTTSINKPTATTTNVFKVTDGSKTPFRVTAQGKLYATDADIKGKVTATSGSFSGAITASSGSVGGWTIAASSIYKTIAGYTTALSAAGTTTTGKVLYVKKDSAYPFYIRADGYMYAAAGQFKGELVAATGTFAGNLSAAGGTFKGSLSAATGTFNGEIANVVGSNKVEIHSASIMMTRANTLMGLIGTNNLKNNTSVKGIEFDLYENGHYMAWTSKKSASADLIYRFVYANKAFSNYAADKFYMHADLDMNSNSIKNFKVNGKTGVTGTISGWYKRDVNENTWYSLKIVVENGVIVSLSG